MNLSEIKKPIPSDFCLLCGGAPDVIGLFIPETPETWGTSAGKTRLIRYCLCSKCHKKPDTPEKVEKVIFADLNGGAVHHA